MGGGKARPRLVHGVWQLLQEDGAGPFGEDGLVLHALGGGYPADSLLHAPVAGLHLRRGVRDAPALECVPHGLPQGRLVVLDGEEVVCVALQYALRDGRLCARGVDGHHCPFYVEPVEQAGYGGYLVLLVRNGLLSDKEVVLRHVRAEYVVALGPGSPRTRTAQFLPVYRHLLLIERRQEGPPVLGQAAAQLLRADSGHQALERVRGRGRVVVGQKVEVPGAHMGELAHVDVVLTAAEVGEEGDHEEVGD